jgi:putative ABC transport system permease protein
VNAPGIHNTPAASREIVGVVADVTYPTRNPQESVEIYLPYLQATWSNTTLFIKTQGEPASVTSAVRSAIRDLDPEQSVSGFKTMDERLAKINGKPRWNTFVLGMFAGLALILAVVGVYGIVSYSVAQRTQEMAVRMALGAQERDILWIAIRGGIFITSIGLALGLIGHLVFARVLSKLIFGVSSSDPVSLAGASCVLAFVALMASYLPARRATCVDPVAALRSE